MIVRNCEDSLRRCIDSILPIGFDEIVIADTGSTDNTRAIVREFATTALDYVDPHPIEIDGQRYISDFAEARNFVLDATKSDYIFWIDADDILYGADVLKNYIDSHIRTGNVGILNMAYYYEFNKYGQCVHRINRVRVARRSENIWRAPLHEVLCATRLSGGTSIQHEMARIEHRGCTPIDIAAKVKRNLLVCQKYLERNPGEHEPRFWMSLGRSYYGAKQWAEAIPNLEKYLDRSGWDEERYYIFMVLAECYNAIGQREKALDVLCRAMRLEPDNREAYTNMAAIFVEAEDYEKAITWCEKALACPTKEDAYSYNPVKETVGPIFLRGLARLHRFEFKESIEDFDRVLKLNPEHKDALINRVIATRGLREQELVDSFKKLEFMIEMEGDREKSISLYQSIPNALRNRPEINLVEKERKRTGTHDICFFCFHEANTWGHDSIEKGGIGGSETAVIRMAEELTKLGWDVTVYGFPSEEQEGVHKGVTWLPWWRAKHDKHAYDVMIAWRTAGVIPNVKSISRYAWLHDVQEEHQWPHTLTPEITGVIVLSQAHRDNVNWIDDSKIFRSANGLDPSWFREPRNSPKRLIYASAPNRGLRELLTLWPRIRERHPDALLDIFYGFNEFYIQHMKQNAALREIHDDVMRLRCQPGINWHGMVDQNRLSQAFHMAGIWAYPTAFNEISPCHGDTIVDTCSGKFKIKDLVGKKDFHVYSIDSTGGLSISRVRGVFRTRRDAPIVRIIGRPSKYSKKTTELLCTPDHEVMLRDGSFHRADKLRPGDRLKIVKTPNGPRGYGEIWATDTPRYPAHRLVASIVYGEGAIMGKDVHHKDGDISNNEPANLEVLSRSDHVSVEHRLSTRKYRGGERWQSSPWRDERVLYSLYVEQGLSAAEIGSRLGCSHNCVLVWLKNFGIDTRSASEAQIVKRHGASHNHLVVSVEPAGNADVYCMEVEPHHNFVANSFVISNCITAMQAQASGAIPVTTRYWALDETVQHGVKVGKVDVGPDREPEQLEEWLSELLSLMGDPKRQDQIRLEMIPWARTTFLWSKVARDWDERFKKDLVMRLASGKPEEPQLVSSAP